MRHSNVFHTGSGKNTYKLWGVVRVEVFVVEGFDDVRLDQLAQEFEVHDEAGVGVWNAFDGNPELKVVAVPVVVGAFAKYFPVFFVGPLRAP